MMETALACSYFVDNGNGHGMTRFAFVLLDEKGEVIFGFSYINGIVQTFIGSQYVGVVSQAIN